MQCWRTSARLDTRLITVNLPLIVISLVAGTAFMVRYVRVLCDRDANVRHRLSAAQACLPIAARQHHTPGGG
jgi:hypothetical protein